MFVGGQQTVEPLIIWRGECVLHLLLPAFTADAATFCCYWTWHWRTRVATSHQTKSFSFWKILKRQEQTDETMLRASQNIFCSTLVGFVACLVDSFCISAGKKLINSLYPLKGEGRINGKMNGMFCNDTRQQKLGRETNIQPDPHWSLLSIALRAEESWFTFKKHITCQKVLSDAKAGRHFN